MSGGLWISPLTPTDFVWALSTIMGQPAQQQWHEGALWLSFRQSGSWGKAALSSAAGMAVGSLVGMGWTSMPRTTELHAQVVDVGQGYTGVGLRARTGTSLSPFKAEDVALMQSIDDQLCRLEGQLLLLRTLYGWDGEAAQLMQADPAVVAARMQELTGMASLEPFTGQDGYDSYDDDIEQAVAAELDKSDEQRQSEARASWQRALEQNDPHVMQNAALDLQHAELYDEAIAAYQQLATAHPAEGPSCAYSVGDCHFFSVYGRDEETAAEQRVQAFDLALQWYGQALQLGEPKDCVEENYWCSCAALIDELDHDPDKQMHYLSLFQRTFPTGEHRHDAADLYRDLTD